MAATCKVWLVIQTVQSPDKQDIIHDVRIMKSKEDAEAVEAEIDEDTFMSVDIREQTIKKDQSIVHVVFHYHDNYSDYDQLFESYEKARAFYQSEVAKMDVDLEEGYYVKLQKNYTGFMATLYDEEDSYPDKGDRWVLTTLHIKSCADAEAAAIGGSVAPARKKRAARTKKNKKCESCAAK